MFERLIMMAADKEPLLFAFIVILLGALAVGKYWWSHQQKTKQLRDDYDALHLFIFGKDGDGGMNKELSDLKTEVAEATGSMKAIIPTLNRVLNSVLSGRSDRDE